MENCCDHCSPRSITLYRPLFRICIWKWSMVQARWSTTSNIGEFAICLWGWCQEQTTNNICRYIPKGHWRCAGAANSNNSIARDTKITSSKNFAWKIWTTSFSWQQCLILTIIHQHHSSNVGKYSRDCFIKFRTNSNEGAALSRIDWDSKDFGKEDQDCKAIEGHAHRKEFIAAKTVQSSWMFDCNFDFGQSNGMEEIVWISH